MNNKTALLEAIRQLPYIAGETNTSGALAVMRTRVFNAEVGDRPDVPNVGIVISDGRATNTSAVGPEIGRVHGSNITTYAIGVTDQIDESSLQQLASEPKEASGQSSRSCGV